MCVLYPLWRASLFALSADALVIGRPRFILDRNSLKAR